MQERPKAEASTPNAFFVDEVTYTVFRQNIKQLQMRCMNLLEVLDAGTSQGGPMSMRLQDAITEASE